MYIVAVHNDRVFLVGPACCMRVCASPSGRRSCGYVRPRFSCGYGRRSSAASVACVFLYNSLGMTSIVITMRVLGEDRMVLLDYCGARRCYSVQGRSCFASSLCDTPRRSSVCCRHQIVRPFHYDGVESLWTRIVWTS